MTEEVTWVKWHFSKWLGDPALRMCSLASRGLWADLLAVMHECQPYGHLLIGEHSPSHSEIAQLVGMSSEKEVRKCLGELVKYRVCGLTESGVIFSRRMVRDKVSRELGKKNGSMGGNPNIVLKPPDEAHETREGVNPFPTSRVKIEKEKEERREEYSLRSPRESAHESEDEGFNAFWDAYPRKDDKGHARKAWKTAVRKVGREAVMAGLARYVFPAERKFQPLPSTWLNGERWADQATMLPAAGSAPHDPWGLNAWIARQTDAVSTTAGRANEPCRAIRGTSIEHSAASIADAVGLPETWRGNWDALGQWLRAGIDPADRLVLEAVGSQATRMRCEGKQIGAIAVFNSAVQQCAGRTGGRTNRATTG